MANHLAHSLSPYLLQHQSNPVDWYEWGSEALHRAARENRPILLSVGYSACHWCHVMAHESFESAEIAALMNELFVNIKVDREERPDLDQLYQSALSVMGEQGGWPLTMFLMPDGTPFWGGTYFPPTPRYGRPGFAAILAQIHTLYREKPDQITQNADRIRTALAQSYQPGTSEKPGTTVTILTKSERAMLARGITRRLDPFFGGLGNAPKFPHCPALLFVWSHWLAEKEIPCQSAVLIALRNMAQGGIYDHLGGGFARYSVDERWLVPHFEKMLYDNAQLIELYTTVWCSERDPLFAARIDETIGWLITEMRNSEGGFFSALDADSEGEEGTFYVWSRSAITAALPAEDLELFCSTYDVTEDGNWEGKTILNRLSAPEQYGDETEERLRAATSILLKLRNQRPRPGLDDKLAVDWNGLLISSLLRAGLCFDRADYLNQAEAAFSFIDQRLRVPGTDGRLFHVWREGKTAQHAMLDDYVYMARAGFDLALVTGSRETLRSVLRWIEIIQEQFADAQGGFFLTGESDNDLFMRPKASFDGALPNASAVLLELYARLYLASTESRWASRVDQLRAILDEQIKAQPIGQARALYASVWCDFGQHLWITGGSEATRKQWRHIASQSAHPFLQVEIDHGGGSLFRINISDQSILETVGYLCQAGYCSPPIRDLQGLRDALNSYISSDISDFTDTIIRKE